MTAVAPPCSDAAELRRLADRYALGMDDADPNAFTDLFVPDGALVVRAPGREEPLGTFRGPGPEGVGLIASLLGELYQATMHHITTHDCEVDGDQGRGTTHCLAYHIVDGDDGPVLETLGVRYEEIYVRTEDGWRFHTREATRLWSSIAPIPAEPLLVDRAAATHRRKPDGDGAA